MSHRRPSSIAAALALIALAPASAAARPAVDAPAHPTTHASAAPARTVADGAGGIDWGSTALGAGGTTIVFALASAGVLAGQRRHQARPARP